MATTIAKKLAAWTLSYDSRALSDTIAAKTSDCILDNLAAALAGCDLMPTSAARNVANDVFGKGPAKIWFGHSKLHRAGAAFCNAMAASSLDFDDGHRAARGHPGSAIIPAVLATLAGNEVPAREVLASIALGYEVSVRLAAAKKNDAIQTHQTGRWVGFGVVAACGRLTGLNIEQMANGFAIGGVWAPNQLANGSSGYACDTGNWAKEGIPISAVQALVAVDLARLGFSGPLDLFDHQSHYACDALVPEDDELSAIASTYFKRYACCRYIHPVLDAWDLLFGSGPVDVEQIEHIEVSTFSWASKLSNKTQPESLVDLQFSLHYCLAVRILYGADALTAPSQSLLHDERAMQLAEKVQLRASEELDARFPDETLAQLYVHTVSGIELLPENGTLT